MYIYIYIYIYTYICIYNIWVNVWKRNVGPQGKHETLKSQQTRMSAIYMHYLNTSCSLGH